MYQGFFDVQPVNLDAATFKLTSEENKSYSEAYAAASSAAAAAKSTFDSVASATQPARKELSEAYTAMSDASSAYNSWVAFSNDFIKMSKSNVSAASLASEQVSSVSEAISVAHKQYKTTIDSYNSVVDMSNSLAKAGQVMTVEQQSAYLRFKAEYEYGGASSTMARLEQDQSSANYVNASCMEVKNSLSAGMLAIKGGAIVKASTAYSEAVASWTEVFARTQMESEQFNSASTALSTADAAASSISEAWSQADADADADSDADADADADGDADVRADKDGTNGNDNLSMGAKEYGVMRGKKGNDTLTGGKGNDTLFGGNGKDALTGGEGADEFVLNNRGKKHADSIADFNSAEGDKIRITGKIGGTFVTVASKKDLKGNSDLIGYNQSNGKMFHYDASTGTAKLVAQFKAGTQISAADVVFGGKP